MYEHFLKHMVNIFHIRGEFFNVQWTFFYKNIHAFLYKCFKYFLCKFHIIYKCSWIVTIFKNVHGLSQFHLRPEQYKHSWKIHGRRRSVSAGHYRAPTTPLWHNERHIECPTQPASVPSQIAGLPFTWPKLLLSQASCFPPGLPAHAALGGADQGHSCSMRSRHWGFGEAVRYPAVHFPL